MTRYNSIKIENLTKEEKELFKTDRQRQMEILKKTDYKENDFLPGLKARVSL
jgi:hypothetical protein